MPAGPLSSVYISTPYVSGHSQPAAAPLRPVVVVALVLSPAPRQTQTASEEVGVCRDFSLTDIVAKCFIVYIQLPLGDHLTKGW